MNMKKRTIHYKKIVGICLALALFLGGVGIIQSILDNQNSEFDDNPVTNVQTKDPAKVEDETPTVVEDTKVLSPVADGIGIVRYFYDKDDTAEKQAASLILFENVYRPNQGVDYSNKNEIFDVVAAISGTVTKKTNDPVLGWVVTITNSNNISTTYESLSVVNVELNQTVKQGDTIGKSGENVYEADLGNHLSFILQVGDKLLNPEKYIGELLTSIR